MSEDKFSSGLNDFLSVTDSNEDDEMMEAPPVKKKAKAEKPKIEPKPAEKVQEPKAEPKAPGKGKNTHKTGKKIYSLYLPPETFDKINDYKKLLGMGAGQFLTTVLQLWETNNPDAVKQLSIVKSLKENMK